MFGLPGGMEWIVILVIGLLLFGRRLPEVARSLGKSIVEFKKGMSDVRDEINDASRDNRLEGPRSSARLENSSGAKSPDSAPKNPVAENH